MRMWVLAGDREHGRVLTGENASLRFAIGMARNLARNAARRAKRERFLPPDDLPEVPVAPDPAPDPGLRAAIDECLELLAQRPREALLARLRGLGARADRALAESIGMSLNTFLQNIVRARRQLAKCLAGKGVPLEEIRS